MQGGVAFLPQALVLPVKKVLRFHCNTAGHGSFINDIDTLGRFVADLLE